MTQPNHQIYKLVKTIRKTPLVLSGIILQILKNWFKANSEQFKYDENPHDSKVVIEHSYLWAPENCQNRPGLYVKRGAYAPKGLARAGMDDLKKIGIDAERQYTVLPACSLAIFCVSKIPGEANKLAWEAAEVLIGMAPIIKRDFNFIAFDLESIGEVGIIEEFKEFFTIPLTISTKFAEAWQVQQIAPKLKKVLVNAYTTLIGELDRGYEDESYSSGRYGK